MRRVLLSGVLVLFVVSCKTKGVTIFSSSPNPMRTSNDYEPFFDILEYAIDEEYGLVDNKPIKVGGLSDTGAIDQRRFLASLAGPNSEELKFFRRGSCCPYSSENGFNGKALVDVYEVSYDGLKEPILVFISFYDQEDLFIPKGFTRRKY